MRKFSQFLAPCISTLFLQQHNHLHPLSWRYQQRYHLPHRRHRSDGRPWAGPDSVPTLKGKGCCAPPTRTFLIQGACSVLTRGAPQRLRPARKGGEQGERGKGSPLTSGSGGFSSGWSEDEKSVLAVISEYCKEGINHVVLSYSSYKPSNKTFSSLTMFLEFDRQFVVIKENLFTLCRFTC